MIMIHTTKAVFIKISIEQCRVNKSHAARVFTNMGTVTKVSVWLFGFNSMHIIGFLWADCEILLLMQHQKAALMKISN
jgi:hypothetical protein